VPPFQVTRDRDAWASIRGFLYQASLTVERWLSLAPDEVLELERGEDIDVVTVNRALGASDVELSRILEQVKHREDSITLRSASVSSFLANAAEHARANPSARLTFRFLTNAYPTHERPTPLSGSRGLVVWEQLRALAPPERPADSRLSAIRELLKTLTRPKDIPFESWVAFQTFVCDSTPEVFSAFVGRIEFSCGSGDYEEVRERISAAAVARQLVGPEDGLAAFQALLMGVLEVLSRTGEKVVRADDVQAALSTGVAATAQQLQRILARVAAAESAAARVESELQKQGQVIRELGTKLVGVAGTSAPQMSLSRRLASAAPRLPVLLVPRRELLSELSQCAAPGRWLALSGRPGLGKSVVAALIADRHGRPIRWLRLRSLTSEQAAEMMAAEIDAAEPDTTLVADDVPRLAPRETPAEILSTVANSLNQQGRSIITTSNFPMPREVLECAQVFVTTRELPPFSNNEAREFLEGFGAPSSITHDRVVAMINGIVGGHPTLLRAAAAYLMDREWLFDSATLGALFSRDFDRDIAEQTQRTMKDTVSENARELIYRLDLVIGTASERMVSALAGAPPPVDRPFEALSEVADVWVQRDQSGAYALSPLAKNLGSRNLTSATKKSVNSVLGHFVLRERVLNQMDAMAALGHLIAAEEFDHAAWVLFSVLTSIEKAPLGIDDFGLLSAWASTELPEGMAPSLKLLIRGTQARVLPRRKRNAKFVLRDLARLVVAAPSESSLVALYAAVSAALGATAENAVDVLELLRRTLPTADQTIAEHRGAPEWPREQSPEQLLLLLAPELTTPVAVRAWASCWDSLSPEQQVRLKASEYFDHAAVTAGSRVWQTESEKPQSVRRWNDVKDALSVLEGAAIRVNAPVLAAAAIRGQAIVLAEHEDRLPDAEAVAALGLARVGADPGSMFLISECLGRQFLMRKRWAEAEASFAAALVAPTPNLLVIRFYALLGAALAASHTGSGRELDVLREAAHVAESIPVLPENERISTLAQIAVAQWRADGIRASFDAWDQAVSRLLAVNERSSEWKDMAVVLGHCLGYLASLAATGQPPSQTPDGQPYAPPEIAFFQSFQKGIGARATESVDAMLCAQMTLLADGVGAYDRAEHWTLVGLEQAERANATLAKGLLTDRALPYLLSTNAFGNVIARSKAVTEPEPNIQPARRERLERELVCVPVALRVGTLTLESDALGELAARECIDAFRARAAGSAVAEPWDAAADLFEHGFVSRSGARTLFDAPRVRGSIKAEWALNATANLLASLQADCPLRTAVAVHTNTAYSILRSLRPTTAFIARLLWPLARTFWITVRRDRSFLLSSPRLVGIQCEGLDGLAPKDALRELLAIFVSDQRASVTDEERKWLATGVVGT
jgi:hypothetical protein